jgi:hypothetical protein
MTNMRPMLVVWRAEGDAQVESTSAGCQHNQEVTDVPWKHARSDNLVVDEMNDEMRGNARE